MSSGFFQANLDTMEFTPTAPDDLNIQVLEGDPDFQVHVLRETSDDTGSVFAGVAKIQPCSIRYEFDANDTIYVVAGEASAVDEATGAAVELRTGDMVSFQKGMAVRLTFKSPFIEMFMSAAG
jgi:uncharacterized cupin superfamily protein